MVVVRVCIHGDKTKLYFPRRKKQMYLFDYLFIFISLRGRRRRFYISDLPKREEAVRLLDWKLGFHFLLQSRLSEPNQYQNDVVDCFSHFSVPPFASRTPPLDFPPVFPQFVSSWSVSPPHARSCIYIYVFVYIHIYVLVYGWLRLFVVVGTNSYSDYSVCMCNCVNLCGILWMWMNWRVWIYAYCAAVWVFGFFGGFRVKSHQCFWIYELIWCYFTHSRFDLFGQVFV